MLRHHTHTHDSQRGGEVYSDRSGLVIWGTCLLAGVYLADEIFSACKNNNFLSHIKYTSAVILKTNLQKTQFNERWCEPRNEHVSIELHNRKPFSTTPTTEKPQCRQ